MKLLAAETITTKIGPLISSSLLGFVMFGAIAYHTLSVVKVKVHDYQECQRSGTRGQASCGRGGEDQ